MTFLPLTPDRRQVTGTSSTSAARTSGTTKPLNWGPPVRRASSPLV